MKVLSIIEPYATLIKEEKKKIETRSWKTSYRGEIYIHASRTKISKENKKRLQFLDLKKNYSSNFGKIICKCELVDCIYMTEEYIKSMKENNIQEYTYGIYEVGRYAWVLKNIEALDSPIEAKGQLGIWNYDLK